MFLAGKTSTSLSILRVVDLGEPFSTIIKLYNESGGSLTQDAE